MPLLGNSHDADCSLIANLVLRKLELVGNKNRWVEVDVHVTWLRKACWLVACDGVLKIMIHEFRVINDSRMWRNIQWRVIMVIFVLLTAHVINWFYKHDPSIKKWNTHRRIFPKLCHPFPAPATTVFSTSVIVVVIAAVNKSVTKIQRHQRKTTPTEKLLICFSQQHVSMTYSIGRVANFFWKNTWQNLLKVY